jgi:hypothetical protein
MQKFFIIIFFLGLIPHSYSQNVLKENTWVLSGSKKNIYFEQGIFRLSSSAEISAPVLLQNIRTHFNKNTKQERIVIDLTGNSLIGIYGSILPSKKKITLDLMQVAKSDSLPSATKGKYLQSVDIYLIEPKLMTLELNFDAVYSFEIFYLLNPMRVVIDVKR